MKLLILLVSLACAVAANAQERRDPFTFSLRPTIVESPAVTPRQNTVDIEKKSSDARQSIADAEAALLDCHSDLCIAHCEAAQVSLKDLPVGRTENLRHDILRIRKAADAMREREETTSAFTKLNLLVTGVVARPRKAQAIVNGVLVREGHTISAGGDELRVESISSERVVLNFRGYRMAAKVGTND